MYIMQMRGFTSNENVFCSPFMKQVNEISYWDTLVGISLPSVNSVTDKERHKMTGDGMFHCLQTVWEREAELFQAALGAELLAGLSMVPWWEALVLLLFLAVDVIQGRGQPASWLWLTAQRRGRRASKTSQLLLHTETELKLTYDPYCCWNSLTVIPSHGFIASTKNGVI